MNRRISRRAAVSAALLAGAAPAAAAVVSPDTDLIQLAEHYLTVSSKTDALMAQMFEAAERGDKATEESLFQQQCMHVPEQHRLLERIMATAAHTPEGMRLKARVALSWVQLDSDGEPHTHEDQVMWSLAQDILRLAGGAA